MKKKLSFNKSTGITILFFIFALAFSLLFNLVYNGGSLGHDEDILIFLAKGRTDILNRIMLLITHGATYYVALPVLLMMVYLFKKEERLKALSVPLSLALFALIGSFIKGIVQRPRPSVVEHLMSETSFSFPSGHTITAVGVYGWIAILLWGKGHKILSILSAIWVFVIGFSRLYIGVHYPSDVLASLSLGGALLILEKGIIDKLSIQRLK